MAHLGTAPSPLGNPYVLGLLARSPPQDLDRGWGGDPRATYVRGDRGPSSSTVALSPMRDDDRGPTVRRVSACGMRSASAVVKRPQSTNRGTAEPATGQCCS